MNPLPMYATNSRSNARDIHLVFLIWPSSSQLINLVFENIYIYTHYIKNKSTSNIAIKYLSRYLPNYYATKKILRICGFGITCIMKHYEKRWWRLTSVKTRQSLYSGEKQEKVQIRSQILLLTRTPKPKMATGTYPMGGRNPYPHPLDGIFTRWVTHTRARVGKCSHTRSRPGNSTRRVTRTRQQTRDLYIFIIYSHAKIISFQQITY